MAADSSPSATPVPAAAWEPDVGPGGWNDFDSLEIGNGSDDGLTEPERQSAMTLWSMAGSPLILGSDLTDRVDELLERRARASACPVGHEPGWRPGS